MFNEEVKVNSHGANSKIKAHILSDEEMKEIGFTNYYEPNWYFCKSIKFPKETRYKGLSCQFQKMVLIFVLMC